MEKFINGLNNELKSEHAVTENGAIGYATTGKNLLDMNFKLASYRHCSDDEIINDFAKAYAEDPLLSVKFMFFAGDIRGGAGERRVFRTCLKWLAGMRPDWGKAILPLVSEYNRWDSLMCLFDTPVEADMLELLKTQLTRDVLDRISGKSISLLAKWMPSANTSSKTTRQLARRIIKAWGWSEKQYRKALSDLRAYLKVTEVSMTANAWGAIDYQAVPSQANIRYRNAFLRHDEERRRDFLEKLSTGEAKINSSVTSPHEIVHAYSMGGWDCKPKEYDQALESMWKSLPDYVQGDGGSIAVVDGSGSMSNTIGCTNITAHNVARGLGLYFAERLSGPFKDKYITFSEKPQLVDFSNLGTLRERLALACRYDACENTNIEAVFDLILNTAVHNRLAQKDLPANIVVISDMEFDACARDSDNRGMDRPLFTIIAKRYRDAGYKLPRLVFWNVDSRTGTIPVQENECGVALVSGFTPAIVKMVLSGKLDPLDVLREMLDSPRYAPVEAALA